MFCKICNTELEAGTIICPGCGTEVAAKNRNFKRLIFWVTAAIIAVSGLAAAILILWFPSGQTANTPTVASPEHIFYLKDNSIYHTYPDQLQPEELVEDFAPGQGRLAPIFLSGNGKLLFYPLGQRNNADLYSCQFDAEQKIHNKLVTKAAIFTTNSDASKLYYLSGHELYTGNMDQFEPIGSKVARFYSNEEGDQVLYLTTDNTLYLKKWNQAARKLDEQVGLRFVSKDLNTIYYRKESTLYLVKDGKDILQIFEGDMSVSIPRLSYLYENGDTYFTYDTSLYYYSNSEEVAKLICNNLKYHLAAYDNSYLYPYRIMYGGTNPPLHIYDDLNSNHIVCKGAEILKKITGGSLMSASFDPEGKGFYYLVLPKAMDESGDLFYASANGTSVSESKLVASNVTYSYLGYVGDNFVYFKNLDYNQADMYIDEQQIDSNVNTWSFSWTNTVLGPNTFFYLKNPRDYYNAKIDEYFTMDTLMLYQDGAIKQIADNVTDFILLKDKILYLKIDDPDSDNGTLHLYDLKGEDMLIDSGVNAIIKPTTNREYHGEIDPAYEEGFYYMGDYAE